MRYYHSFRNVIPHKEVGSLRVTHPSAMHPEGHIRLACVRHAASVHSEPGSNSHVQSSSCSHDPHGSRKNALVIRLRLLWISRPRPTQRLPFFSIRLSKTPALPRPQTLKPVSPTGNYTRLLAASLPPRPTHHRRRHLDYHTTTPTQALFFRTSPGGSLPQVFQAPDRFERRTDVGDTSRPRKQPPRRTRFSTTRVRGAFWNARRRAIAQAWGKRGASCCDHRSWTCGFGSRLAVG